MKRLLWVALVVAATPTISAQNPSDTSDGAEAQQLRHELRQRWNERVRQDLRLSGDQAAKLQATEDRYLDSAQRRRLLAGPEDAAGDLYPRREPGIRARRQADSTARVRLPSRPARETGRHGHGRGVRLRPCRRTPRPTRRHAASSTDVAASPEQITSM